MNLDTEACYRACLGRDSRFDGQFYLGVLTTGIYCLPSCPARTPLPHNCRFFPTAAAAVAAGFRACLRCRPDRLVVGHRRRHGELVDRAVQLIHDGVVDRVGVAGLASRLHVSQRHLHRQLVAEVGAGAQQLNQTRRAQVARALIDQTTMTLAEVAFAAGFGSIRQFNEVLRAEFGVPPSALRRAPAEARNESLADPELALRLPYRPPLAWDALRAALQAHAVADVESVTETTHTRLVPTTTGGALATVAWPLAPTDTVGVKLRLTTLTDLLPAITAMRRWLDLDADPGIVDEALSTDETLSPLVAARPGMRVPGAVDGAEFALFTVLGQRISLKSALTVQARLVAEFGIPAGPGGPWRRMEPAALVEAGADRIREALRLPQAKAQTLYALAVELAGGLELSPGADPNRTRARLTAIHGIGEWTAEFIAMRALADPDACPTADLVLARALGVAPGRPVSRRAEPWRPWRAYATMHLWTKESYL